MHKLLLAAVVFLAISSTGFAAEEIVKDDFENQAEGHQLSELINWKFHAGWIKPEYGKVTVENGNKFLRMRGDIFSRNPCALEDKLTFRFKIRATGTDEELGGLTLRPPSGKLRYDILFVYKQGAVVLAKDASGNRETIEKADGVKVNVFQDVIVTLERVTSGVKFTISVDGNKLIEKVDTQELPFLKDSFTAGFFTFNQKTIDVDDADFSRGK